MYLDDHPEDRANGFAPPRQLHVKTTPVNIERPQQPKRVLSCDLAQTPTSCAGGLSTTP